MSISGAYTGEVVLVWNKEKDVGRYYLQKSPLDPATGGKGGWAPAVVARRSGRDIGEHVVLPTLKLNYFDLNGELNWPGRAVSLENSGFDTTRFLYGSPTMERSLEPPKDDKSNIIRLIDPSSAQSHVPIDFTSLKGHDFPGTGALSGWNIYQRNDSGELYVFSEVKEIEGFEMYKVEEEGHGGKRTEKKRSSTKKKSLNLWAAGIGTLLFIVLWLGISKVFSSSGTQAAVQTGGGSRTKRRRSRTRRSRTRRSRTRRSRRSRTSRSRRKRTKRTKRNRRN